MIFLADFQQLFFLVENLFSLFCSSGLLHFFTRVTSKQCSCPKIIWKSSCYVNTKKTNLQQFILQWWRLQDSNFNGAWLHQRDLIEKFKQNNYAKVNCLMLKTQEKPSRMISLAYNLPKTMSNFCPSKLHRKK